MLFRLLRFSGLRTVLLKVKIVVLPHLHFLIKRVFRVYLKAKRKKNCSLRKCLFTEQSVFISCQKLNWPK